MPIGNRRLLGVVLVVLVVLAGTVVVAVGADDGAGEDRLATTGGAGGPRGERGDRDREDEDRARRDGTTTTASGTGAGEDAAAGEGGTTVAPEGSGSGPGGGSGGPGGSGGAGGAGGAGGGAAPGGGSSPTGGGRPPPGPCTYGQPLSGTTLVASTRSNAGVTPDGVGLVIGHSNGVPIGNQFVALARAESSFPWVNAAASGVDAAEWARRSRWTAGGPVDQALAAAGRSRGNVQVVLMAALSTRALDPNSTTIGAEWTNHLLGILSVIEQEMPSVRVVYVTGPISHAHQAAGSQNAEPSAYRHGQGVIDAMNRYQGPITIVFGPYLWNDPTCPRTDGLYLDRQYLADDIHPNDAGARYLAGYMVDFFRRHPTSQGWW